MRPAQPEHKQLPSTIGSTGDSPRRSQEPAERCHTLPAWSLLCCTSREGAVLRGQSSGAGQSAPL
eukprot:13202525-Alexandrium_andersonii.AAC.1